MTAKRDEIRNGIQVLIVIVLGAVVCYASYWFYWNVSFSPPRASEQYIKNALDAAKHFNQNASNDFLMCLHKKSSRDDYLFTTDVDRCLYLAMDNHN